jgi:hypothetical protein
MRHSTSVIVLVVGVSACASRSDAQTSGSIEGFGGASFSSFSTTENTFRPDLGGTVSVALIPNLHLVGEGGRLGSVMSPLADTVYSFAGLGLEASALYFEGGVRLIGAPQSAVSPYVEATAGAARISLHATGLGSFGNAALPIAFSLLPRTGPVAGLGGGVVFHAGALQMHLGYRFKQLSPPDALSAVLGLGQSLRSQQVRFGLGVRF